MKTFAAAVMTAAAVSADSQFLYNVNPAIMPATTYIKPAVAVAQPIAAAQPLQYINPAVEYKFVKPEMKEVEIKPVEYKMKEMPKPIEYKTVVEKKNVGVEYKTVVEKKPVATIAQPMVYNTMPYTYATGMPIVPATYAAQPVVYSTEQKIVAKPIVAYNAKVKSYANDAINPATNYAAKNEYRAETDGSLHIAKRDADSDAQLFLNNGYGFQYPSVYSSGYKYVNPVSYTAGVSAYQPTYYNNYAARYVNPYFF